jgi:hypothetical protein
VKPSKKGLILPPYAIPFEALATYAGLPFEKYAETVRSGSAYSAKNTRITVFEFGYAQAYSAIEICILKDQRPAAEQDYPEFLTYTDMDDRDDIFLVEVTPCETHADILYQVML